MKKASSRTLRTDHFLEAGVNIEQINLRCNSCGECFTAPAPSASGKFPRCWHECPKGCNSKAA